MAQNFTETDLVPIFKEKLAQDLKDDHIFYSCWRLINLY